MSGWHVEEKGVDENGNTYEVRVSARNEEAKIHYSIVEEPERDYTVLNVLGTILFVALVVAFFILFL